MKTYRIKNWAKFQHFKDRHPPWIKLYRDILDDLDWHELDPKAAKVLVMLWVIASEDSSGNGLLPDAKTLAFRLRMSVDQIDITLSQLEKWLDHVDITLSQQQETTRYHDDITTISNGYQNDTKVVPLARSRETETETETEGERETEAEARAKPSGKSKKQKTEILPAPDFGGEPLAKAWADFIAHRAGIKKPMTALAAQKNIALLREADAEGYCPVALLDKAIANSWQGLYRPKLGDKRKEDPSSKPRMIGGMRVGKNWV